MKESANSFYKVFEDKFKNWADGVKDIRAAFMIGSRARVDHPADEFSDMDIVLYTSNPEIYLNNAVWINNLGEVLSTFVTPTAGGEPECLTLFKGGWQVDFVVLSTDILNRIVKEKIIPENFHRGVRVIVDKDNISENILPKQFHSPKSTAITEDMFLRTVNMFWFTAFYLGKQISRNELWVAKMRDNDIKSLLLQMIEWHEKLTNGNQYDTWHAGRFLFDWVSKETQEELKNTFGNFNKTDSLNALFSTIKLFKRLSHEICIKMDYAYPHELEEYVYSWISDKIEE